MDAYSAPELLNALEAAADHAATDIVQVWFPVYSLAAYLHIN